MRFKASLSAVLSVALAAFGLTQVVLAAPASALQGTLPGAAASSWQTNGAVWAISYAKGVVYLGGDFTSVRPPGAPAGTGEVARNHLAAFNANTGALITSFNHNVDASVRSLASSLDGSTLYVGGDFKTVDGVSRTRVAAFSTSSGALTAFAPTADGRVASIVPAPGALYLGGSFGRINSKANSRIVAKVNPDTGALISGFAVPLDNIVYAMALSPSYDKLYLAGAFTQVNGDTSRSAADVVDASTGANLPFAAGSVIPQNSDACTVQAKSVKTDADGVYFGVEGTGGGCFDGTFSASLSDGSLRWVSHCLGATQAVQPLNGMLYTGSHSHDCSGDQGVDPDAFPEIGWSKGLSRHLLSRSTSTGQLGTWYPNTDGGPGNKGLGPRVIETDGSQLFVGGEFTSVNGVAQQGFARFSPNGPEAAPNRPATPVAVAVAGGKVQVFVQAPLDLDDTDLTVRIYRDGGSTPIASLPAHSLFWKQPVLGFVDSGVAAGSTHTYTADAIDANGPATSALSPTSRPVTVAATSSYETAVDQDSPALYWRLGEKNGSVGADSSSSLNGAIYNSSGISYNVAGATGDGNTAITTNGSAGYLSSTDIQPSPTTYSVEAWFKTTSTSGGKIVGFGDRQQGLDFGGNIALSGSYDKHIYMTDDGHLTFGVWVGYADVLTSSASYNDGQWHEVVGTQGPKGLTLFVDGARVAHDGQTANQSYNGYWRVGGDNLNGWPNKPSSAFFAGSIDDVAVYSSALSLAQVDAHYAASGRTAPAEQTPTDSYGKAIYQDGASTYWRLDESGPSTASDASGNGNDGVYSGGVQQGQAPAVPFGSAVAFDGQSGAVAAGSAVQGPSVYSAEFWVKTTTTSGGKLVGFGNAQTGMSGNYDRHVYMLNDGRIVFGVWNGQPDTIYSTAALNDGQWHYVVATQGADGMALYVDDQLVGSNAVATSQPYAGYWRVGGDSLGAWPDQPSSAYFAGAIDEVAIYDTALSASQVDAHYVAAGHPGHG